MSGTTEVKYYQVHCWRNSWHWARFEAKSLAELVVLYGRLKRSGHFSLIEVRPIV